MAWPTEPTESLPLWAYGGSAEKIDPTDAKRALGWTFDPSNSAYGEQPPYQWQNNEMYNNGVWVEYLKNVLEFLRVNPAPFVPSIAVLGFAETVLVPPDGSTNMNFDSNSYFNYSGFPLFNASNQTLAAPFDGFCKVDFSTISQSTIASGQNNIQYNYNVQRNSTTLFSYTGRTASTNPGSDTPIFLSDSFSTGFAVNAGQTVGIEFSNGDQNFIFPAAQIATITFFRTASS